MTRVGGQCLGGSPLCHLTEAHELPWMGLNLTSCVNTHGSQLGSFISLFCCSSALSPSFLSPSVLFLSLLLHLPARASPAVYLALAFGHETWSTPCPSPALSFPVSNPAASALKSSSSATESLTIKESPFVKDLDRFPSSVHVFLKAEQTLTFPFLSKCILIVLQHVLGMPQLSFRNRDRAIGSMVPKSSGRERQALSKASLLLSPQLRSRGSSTISDRMVLRTRAPVQASSLRVLQHRTRTVSGSLLSHFPYLIRRASVGKSGLVALLTRCSNSRCIHLDTRFSLNHQDVSRHLYCRRHVITADD